VLRGGRPRACSGPLLSGLRVQGAGFRVQGAGFRVQGAGCRVQGAGFRVQGFEFGIRGSGYGGLPEAAQRCVTSCLAMASTPPPPLADCTRPPEPENTVCAETSLSISLLSLSLPNPNPNAKNTCLQRVSCQGPRRGVTRRVWRWRQTLHQQIHPPVR